MKGNYHGVDFNQTPNYWQDPCCNTEGYVITYGLIATMTWQAYKLVNFTDGKHTFTVAAKCEI